jgi:hypothetical protein
MDEIVAIDTNSTLDMYTTVSKDGTVALRCLRTSKLWHLFKLCIPKEIKGHHKPIYGFSKIFRHVAYVKLSLHGYIVVIGRTTT